MKNELGGQIMKEFVGLRAKTYSCLKGSNNEDKKQKAQKSVSIKENLNIKIIKTVQKHLKLKIKQTIWEKKLMQIVWKIKKNS